jgi:plastocyanin
MTSTRQAIRLAAALAGLLLLAACANDDGSAVAGADTAATGATAITGATGTTGPTGTTGGGGQGRGYGYGGGDDGGGKDGGGGGGSDIDVRADNFSFAPADVEIEAGEDIHVKNGNAATPHTFTVDGTDIDLELEPMETEEAVVDLDPGTYDFFCRFHPQMTGTLTVV